MAFGIFKKIQKKFTRRLPKEPWKKEEKHFRIMSFNVKGIEEEKSEDSWCLRKNYIASMIRFHRMDVIGFQEPHWNHIEDLNNLLPEYGWYGIGVNDAKKEGSFNAIFWKKQRFSLINQGFFFLSPTPDVPALGWGAYFVRGVTWCKLFDKKAKGAFYIFNTHFDYHSLEARNESACLLLKKIKEIANDCPYVVVGDFNLFPSLHGMETYKILTKKDLIDAQKATHFPHHGPTGSWSGFKKAGDPGIKPDYIFVKKKGTKVISHGILSDTFDGRFPSDHLPVVAEICFT